MVNHKEDEAILTKHIMKQSNVKNKYKILLVEDNITNQKLTAKVLNNCGYICDIANNGREAINAYNAVNYDLILMDCQMPVMDGYEATMIIREMEHNEKHIPIIAMTANALEGDEEKCLISGMDGYITKPINQKTLISEIEKVINDELVINKVESNPQDKYLKILQVIVDGHEFTNEEAEELLAEYIKSLLDMTITITNAIKENNFKAIAEKAHSLKGTSGNLNINELRESAIELEIAAKVTNIELCKEACDKISMFIKSINYNN
ncbi:MAG: response regulator [bacterium]